MATKELKITDDATASLPARAKPAGRQTSVRKRPQQERSKSTVDVILATSAQLIAREGYGKISTNRIARVAGVSIGSLYQYFPSKESILLELFEREVATGLSALEARLEPTRGQPWTTFLDTLVGGRRVPFDGNLELARVIHEQMPVLGKLGRVVETHRRLTEILLVHLKPRAAELRADLTPEMAAFLIAHSCLGVQTGLLMAPVGVSAEDAYRALQSTLAHYFK